MTACNVACCEEPGDVHGMCAPHDEYFRPRSRPDETWRTTPYEDRPAATAGTRALATHASRAQAVLDVFTGAAFKPVARPTVRPLLTDPPIVAWRPCEPCMRELGSVVHPASLRRRVAPPGVMAPGSTPTDDEEREYREACCAIRTHCFEAHSTPAEAAA